MWTYILTVGLSAVFLAKFFFYRNRSWWIGYYGSMGCSAHSGRQPRDTGELPIAGPISLPFLMEKDHTQTNDWADRATTFWSQNPVKSSENKRINEIIRPEDMSLFQH